MNDHLSIWNRVEKTDPKYTKAFSRGGGFRGTATNATWLVKRATDTFGPCGLGWGYEITEESFREGGPLLVENGQVLCHEVIHQVRLRLWYRQGDQTGEVMHFGQTTFVGKNKHGIFTDEEAPKKSLTDALTKCLSMLGFAGDVHLGLWDDNKYVAQRQEESSRDAALSDTKQAKALIAGALGKRGIVNGGMAAIVNGWLDGREFEDTSTDERRTFIAEINAGKHDPGHGEPTPEELAEVQPEAAPRKTGKAA